MTHVKAFKNSFSQGVSRSTTPVKKRGIMLIFDDFFLFFIKIWALFGKYDQFFFARMSWDF